MTNDDTKVWAIFYASVHAMQMHPGNKNPMTARESADEADIMLAHYIKRRKQCHSQQEPQQAQAYSEMY